MNPRTYTEELAHRSGFKPYQEFSVAEQQGIEQYVESWYKRSDPILFDASGYWWKESSIGDGNWISFNVKPLNRIAAPHLA